MCLCLPQQAWGLRCVCVFCMGVRIWACVCLCVSERESLNCELANLFGTAVPTRKQNWEKLFRVSAASHRGKFCAQVVSLMCDIYFFMMISVVVIFFFFLLYLYSLSLCFLFMLQLLVSYISQNALWHPQKTAPNLLLPAGFYKRQRQKLLKVILVFKSVCIREKHKKNILKTQ